MASFTAEQVAALTAPLDKRHVKERTQSGRTLSYIEGWQAIAEANRIFGFAAWNRETVEMREVRPPELVRSAKGSETWRVGFLCRVRVTVNGVVREGTGYGSGALPDLGDAYESAFKEAETDAMKRALMTFGNPFGLALYDKTQANVTSGNGELKAALVASTREPPPAGSLDANGKPYKHGMRIEPEMRNLWTELKNELDAQPSLAMLRLKWFSPSFQEEKARIKLDWQDELAAHCDALIASWNQRGEAPEPRNLGEHLDRMEAEGAGGPQ
jgi:DNA recombination protein Rad52